MSDTQPSSAETVAELNDLLQLDHDAVQAYSMAIGQVRSGSFRDDLVRFRADHQRHIDELTELIQARGGIPVQLPHLPTGVFKLAMQSLGAVGGDREVLLAFKANEAQVRDKYRRHAERAVALDVKDVLVRALADEERHYAWADESVRALGGGPGTPQDMVQDAVETVHGRTADAIESVGRRVMETVERMRPGGSA
ncbi:MAG TPA: ferritin-like domain-containing protein [Longimicrobium sp.]|nr:ferritin-like domain-containing protein [Longimicrobium sp.]